jgi:hypothetical protein
LFLAISYYTPTLCFPLLFLQSVTATTLGSPLRSFLIGAAVGGLGYAAYKGLKKAYKCGKYGCPPDYGYGGYGMGGMGGYGMGGMGGYGNGRYF